MTELGYTVEPHRSTQTKPATKTSELYVYLAVVPSQSVRISGQRLSKPPIRSGGIRLATFANPRLGYDTSVE